MKGIHNNLNFDGYFIKNFVRLSNREKGLVRNWRNHKEIRQWMYTDHKISVQEHKKFLKSLRGNKKSLYWLVQCKENRDYVGVIYLKVDSKNRNAYLGLYACPGLKGIGLELIKLLKTIAFRKMKLHTLKLETMTTNKRALKLFKQTGFRVEGQLKQIVYKSGRYFDLIVMGCMNPKG